MQDKQPKTTRRNAIKTIGTAGLGIIGGSRFLVREVDALSVNENHSTSDTVSSGYGKYIDQGTGIAQYDADARTGTTNYWAIPFKAASNSAAYDSSDDPFEGLIANYSKLHSSHDKWDINTTKYWVGGGQWNTPEDQDDYPSWAYDAGSAAAGLVLPEAAWVLDSIEILYSFISDVYDEFNTGTDILYERRWLWKDYGLGDPTRQGGTYNKFTAELDPGERAGFTLNEWSTAGDGGTLFQTDNELLVNFQAPSYSPSDIEVGSLSSYQLKQKEISAVKRSRIQRQPERYGYTPVQANKIDSPVVYFHPVKTEFTTN